MHVTASRYILALALSLPITVSAAAPRAQELIEIKGNLVMPQEVYFTILDLPKGAKASKATALRVQEQILRFLQRSGYELAKVSAEVKDERISVKIDEGRVARVVVRGPGTVRQLEFLLALDLPHDVFNRPHLQRQLKVLAKRYNFAVATFELVPVKKVDHVGFQLEDIEFLDEALSLRQPTVAYELHLLFGRTDWQTGLNISLHIRQPDGMTTGLGYRGQSLVMNEDRWEAGAWISLHSFRHMEDEGSYFSMSRAQALAKWYTPPLGSTRLRPGLWLRGDVQRRQRLDLNVEVYEWATVDSTINLSHTFAEGMSMDIGAGGQFRRLIGTRQPGPTRLSFVEDRVQIVPIVLAALELDFDPREPRRDRRHRLDIEPSVLFDEGEVEWIVRGEYQRIVPFGWHDLFLRLRGAIMGDNVPFPEEQPTSAFVRGVFPGIFYSQRALGATVEFRHSFTRDVVKLSAFADGALFLDQSLLPEQPDPDRIARLSEPRGATSVGVGFHTLVANFIQVDIYYGFGFATNGDRDRGLSAAIRRAF